MEKWKKLPIILQVIENPILANVCTVYAAVMNFLLLLLIVAVDHHKTVVALLLLLLVVDKECCLPFYKTTHYELGFLSLASKNI